MLKPAECFAGTLSSATQMTLILPRSQYEDTILVCPFDETLQAIYLTSYQGNYVFHEVQRDAVGMCKGLHIPGVAIELDESSLFDPSGYNRPLGTLSRHEDKLSMTIILEGSGYTGRSFQLPLLTGLPPCSENETASFLKWQITLGDEHEKRVLHQVSIEPRKPEQ